MYLTDYFWFLGAMLLCMAFSVFANAKIYRAYAKYSGIRTRSGMTGYDTAAKLMGANGVHGIAIGKVRGNLTDHYNPSKRIVNLSEATYSGNSVAAVAVAAHETGHVLQKKDGYFLFRLRTAIVPAVNIGSYLSLPLVLAGLIIDLIIGSAKADIGFYVALVGVVLYGGSFIFALITLPVEYNASRRAKKMLLSEGVLTQEELGGAGEVLSAAALTYLASLLTSLVYFLRFFVFVITMFGRRDGK